MSSSHSTLDQLAKAISDGPAGHVEDYARVDLQRATRKGVPEVILAERKTADQTVAITRRMLESTGRAIISRVPPATVVALEAAFGEGVSWERGTSSRTIVLHRADA